LHILPNMTWGGAPYAVIENVGVEAASRGAGVGRALMAHLAECAEAAGCWKVMAQTGPAKGAAGFYAACGFDAEGRSGFIMRFEANMRSGERMEKMR
ncbi:MAG: GNAT family N-acetyltransferase, partial [Pseudomonadota bacterium]